MRARTTAVTTTLNRRGARRAVRGRGPADALGAAPAGGRSLPGCGAGAAESGPRRVARRPARRRCGPTRPCGPRRRPSSRGRPTSARPGRGPSPPRAASRPTAGTGGESPAASLTSSSQPVPRRGQRRPHRGSAVPEAVAHQLLEGEQQPVDVVVGGAGPAGLRRELRPAAASAGHGVRRASSARRARRRLRASSRPGLGRVAHRASLMSLLPAAVPVGGSGEHRLYSPTAASGGHVTQRAQIARAATRQRRPGGGLGCPAPLRRDPRDRAKW